MWCMEELETFRTRRSQPRYDGQSKSWDLGRTLYPVLQIEGLKRAIMAGYSVLSGSAGDQDLRPAVKAVVEAVSVLEDDPAFNAGYGAVLNEEGQVEHDAGVVDGNDMGYGAVASIGMK